MQARATFRVRPATVCGLLAITLLLAVDGSRAASGWMDTLDEALGSQKSATTTLPADDVARGLREALQVGTERVVSRLGRTDGFNADPAIHIPLPRDLEKIRGVLEHAGMDSMLTDLETRLNRAAELATPKAKDLFLDAIGDLTLDDAVSIYQGPDDAATQYFRTRMSKPLAAAMKPIVDQSLADAGAVQAFDQLMQRYSTIPLAPKVKANLNDYVVKKGTDGIFYYLAREEAAIRKDPAKRTTELLRSVFGH